MQGEAEKVIRMRYTGAMEQVSCGQKWLIVYYSFVQISHFMIFFRTCGTRIGRRLAPAVT